ncbi:uncharacterized protein [Salvelinus alpinus]|uniref:uncharacterized protein isoform X1 n=1 Tax=Salvelinus alpinus TaxID=8036 RepID=UPI0039FDC5F9
MHASTLRTLHQTSAVMLCLTSSFSPVVLFTNTHDWLNCSGELRTTNEQDKGSTCCRQAGAVCPRLPVPKSPRPVPSPSGPAPSPAWWEFCIKHVLEDKNAPYRQCRYVSNKNGKRFPNAAPKVDNKEWVTFCVEHFRWNAMALQAQLRKASSGPSPESFLSLLSGYNCTETHEQDSGRSEASLILGVKCFCTIFFLSTHMHWQHILTSYFIYRRPCTTKCVAPYLTAHFLLSGVLIAVLFYNSCYSR